MTPPRQRKAGPAEAPLIQDRPAAPAQKRPVLDPANRDGEFLPNPVPSPRQGRLEPYTRYLKVVGPKEVGGVMAPGWVTMNLTDPELEALIWGGHVVDYPAGAGWGSDDTPESEPGAEAPPKDGPKAGADKEGS